MENEATTALATKTNGPGSHWRAILQRPTQEAFAAAFRPDVALETALFDGSATGPVALRAFFDATRDLYEHIAFVRETAGEGSTVLEWEGRAFGGKAVNGVTILAHDTDGKIARVTLFHRPHAMVIACAAHLARELAGRLEPDVHWPSS